MIQSFLIRNFQNLKSEEKYFFSLIILDTLLLTFLGKQYTKFEILGHVHAHDLFLAFIFTASFWFKPRMKIKHVELLLAIALLYLLLSVPRALRLQDGWYVVVRQYMIYGYLMIGYFIIRAISSYKNGLQLTYWFIIFIGFLAVITQIGHITYLLVFKEDFFFFERHTISEMIVIGIIVFAAYSLVYHKGIIGHLCFAFAIILSITTGKDSAYLSLVVVYLMFHFLRVSSQLKIIIFIIFLICIALFIVFVPTFSDTNMMWRIIYWRDTIKELFITKNIFFGKGFGVPYLEEYTRANLNYLMESHGFAVEISLKERYEVTSHNSFISMVYHLGIFNFLLFLYPLKTLYFKMKILVKDKMIFSLTLILFGIFVWASFNLVMELPHSSSFFWIIFFTLLFVLKNHEDKLSDININDYRNNG